MNVLCCHDTLLEMSLSRACVGDFLLARGGGQISPGQWDIVGVISGHVFANTVRYIPEVMKTGSAAVKLFTTFPV